MHLFCTKKQGLSLRLEEEGGTVAALLRNKLTFWSSHPARWHFEAHSRQISPARFFFKMRYDWMYSSQVYSGAP